MSAPRSRRRVWFGRTLIVGAALSGLSFVGLVTGLVWLRSGAGNRWLTGQVTTALQGALHEGTVEIGSIDTNAFARIDIRDVRLRDGDGVEVIGADRLLVRYSLWSLVTGTVTVKSVEAQGLVFDVRTAADGTTSLTSLFGPSDPNAPPSGPWEGLPVDLVVSSIRVIDGRVRWATATDAWGAEDLDVRGSVSLTGPRVEVVGLGVAANLTDFATGPVAVGAEGLAWDGQRAEIGGLSASALGTEVRAGGLVTDLTGDPVVAVAARLAPADLTAIDAFLGGVGLGGKWTGVVWATGTTAALRPHVDLVGIDGSVGRLEVDALADLTAEDLPWTATIDADAFHAHHVYTPLATMVESLGDEVIVTGHIDASGHGKTWPDGLVVDATLDGGPVRVFGMDYDKVDASLGLAGGVLTIASLDTDGPMGDLDGDGTIDLAKGPIDLHLKGTFAASQLSVFGADGFGGGGWLDATFRGDPRAANPVYVARGRIVADDLTYGEEIRVDHATGETEVRIDSAGVRVTANVEGTSGEAYGTSFEAVQEPELLVVVGFGGDIVVSGRGAVQGAELPGVAAITTAEGPWSYTLADGQEGVFETHLVLGSHELFGVVTGDRGRADVVLADDVVTFRADLWEGSRSTVDAEGTFAIVDGQVTVDHLALSPTEGYRYEAAEPVRLRLTDGGIADAHVVIDGAAGERIEIDGALGTTGPLDAQVIVTDFDLGVVAALYPESAGSVSGKASLAVGLGGTADQMIVGGEVSFVGTVVAGQTKPLTVTGTVDGADDVVRVDVHSEIGDDDLVDVHGTVPVNLDLGDLGVAADGDVDLVVDLHPGSLDRFEEFSSDVPSGRASAHVEAHGPIRDPRVDIGAVVETAVEGWDAPMRAEIGVTRADGHVKTWGDVYEGYAPRGTVDAVATDEVAKWIAWALGEGPRPPPDSYSAYASSVRADAHLVDVPIVSLFALFGLPYEVSGRIEGDISIVGSPDTPVVQADVQWVDGHLDDVQIDLAQIKIDPIDDGYSVSADLRTGDGSMHFGGEVPIYLDLRKDPRSWGTGVLGLQLVADRLPLAVVAAFVPDLAEAEGYLTIEGEVTGAVDNPQATVRVAIVDGALSYLPIGVRYSNIQMSAMASRQVLHVESLTLDTAPIQGGAGLARGSVVAGSEQEAKPDLSLTGRIGIEDGAPTDVAVTIDLATFHATALPDQLVVLNGDVSATGDWPEVVVRGDVKVQSGLYVVDAASFLDEGPTVLDQRLVVHRGGQAYERPVVDGPPPVWHSFDIALGVEVTRNLQLEVLFPFLTSYGSLGAALTTAKVEARLSGDLDLVVRGGDIDMRGEIDVIEGGVDVMQSSFDLEEGRVTFQGDPADPFLDLTARMDVSDGTYVELGVRGLTSAPAIDLSSPDYPSDSQILTVLLTGQPPDDLSATQGAAATQALMNMLLTSVIGGARLGSVSIDGDGTVRVGLPLGRVYAEVLYRIDPDIDENHYAVDYEIQLARRFLIDGTLGDRESMIDLLWELRF